MLCWWNSHYTFNDAHIWILDATYITKQAIDERYIHCTNVASWSLRPRLNYRNSWSRNSHCKAIILDSSYKCYPISHDRNSRYFILDPLYIAYWTHQEDQNLYLLILDLSYIPCTRGYGIKLYQIFSDMRS